MLSFQFNWYIPHPLFLGNIHAEHPVCLNDITDSFENNEIKPTHCTVKTLFSIQLTKRIRFMPIMRIRFMPIVSLVRIGHSVKVKKIIRITQIVLTAWILWVIFFAVKDVIALKIWVVCNLLVAGTLIIQTILPTVPTNWDTTKICQWIVTPLHGCVNF